MDVASIISTYPEKSLSQTFFDRSSALIQLGSPPDQIENKKDQYKKLFEYDNELLVLKGRLDQIKDIDDEYV